jgi:hypothetical protein
MQHFLGLFPSLEERLGRHLPTEKIPKMFDTNSTFPRLIAQEAFIAFTKKASNHINLKYIQKKQNVIHNGKHENQTLFMGDQEKQHCTSQMQLTTKKMTKGKPQTNGVKLLVIHKKQLLN